MSDILSREEVERRLAECVLLGGNVREREALETALAAMNERDEALGEGPC